MAYNGTVETELVQYTELSPSGICYMILKIFNNKDDVRLAVPCKKTTRNNMAVNKK